MKNDSSTPRPFRRVVLGIAAAMMGCGGGGTGGDLPAAPPSVDDRVAAPPRPQTEVRGRAAPPQSLRYADEAAVYPTGQSILPNRPTTTGGEVASFGIVPDLPPGLVFDPSNGVISGTPSLAMPPMQFTVTGKNRDGIAATMLTIEVREALEAPDLPQPVQASPA